MKTSATSTLLTRKRRQPKTKLFMAVFVVILVLVVVNQVFVNINTRQAQAYSQLVSDMSVLSQDLTNFALAAGVGDSAGFSGLASARGEFQSALSLIRDGAPGYISSGVGFAAPLAGKGNIIEREFPDFVPTWNQVSSDTNRLLELQGQFTALVEQAVNVGNIIPLVQNEYSGAVDALAGSNVALATLAAVQRQSWLAERIASNLNIIIAGNSSQRQVDQFQEDITQFNEYHDALLNGSNTLGITRLANADAVDSLRNISALLPGIQAPVSNIINAIPEINAVAAAVSQIEENSEILLAEVNKFGEAIAASGNAQQLGSPVIGYGLLLAMLVTILAYGQQVLKQSQESEQVTAEKNTRNNEAVMKLVSEISGLAHGDLTVKATVGEDFTGAIADSINYAVDQLRDLVAAITSVSNDVTKSTESSRQTVESLSDATKRQSESINSVHNSIREIGEGISQVNENAQKTLDVARKSVESAQGGANVVKDTISGMDNIRDQIQDTSKRIKRLGESSQEIGNFVSLINDIAEHTNTLSLNAAIQAATAGDAGKGFAVVADEVHALAERSADATRQIESLVKVIQGDIKDAVRSMEETTSEVVAGTKLAKSAGEALDDIQRVSRELQELVDSINEASSNQSKAASEITHSMDVIHEMTVNTTSGVEATNEFMTSLGALTERLQNAVEGFSLEEKDGKWAARGKSAKAEGDMSMRQSPKTANA